MERLFLICDAIFKNKFTLLFLVLPRTEGQNLQEPVQVVSHINLSPDIKPGGHASTVSKCALSYSIIFGKTNKYIFPFTRRQEDYRSDL